MTDALTAVDTAINHLSQQRDRAVSIIALLQTSRQQIHELSAPAETTSPALEKEARSTRKAQAARREKRAKDAPATKHRMVRKEYTREDVVEIAVALIRKNGPQKARDITKEVVAIFPKGDTPVSSYLSQERNKVARRITRNDDGLWEIATTARAVKDDRSPEEIKKAFAQAKANAERPVTSDIRA